MDRNREARRVTMAAAGNGLSRRRHRAGSFRDSPEEDGPAELPEAARLRDRGGSLKKDRDRDRDRDRERDRLNSRSKRRRGERLMMMHGNMEDGGGDDSSEESVNDDEEYDDGGGGGPPSSVKMLPPASNNPTASFSSSSLSNHHNSSGGLHQRKSFTPAKVFRSSPSPATTPAAAAASPLVSPWKAADEMIGVSVPRKARSASTKRPHESWASSVTGGGVFASGEQIHRQVSTSPARASPASMLTSPSPPAPPSPSSSSVSVRKKMPSGPKEKPLPPKTTSCKSSSSPVAAQDEIEIEIAEVLYGMMRQPLGPSKQEVAGNDSGEAGNISPGIKSTGEVKSRVSSPISNSQTTVPQSSLTLAPNSSSSNVSAIAPKRKKPRPIKYEDENNSALPSRVSPISSNIKAEPEAPSPNQGKISGSTGENSCGLDSMNPPGLSAAPPSTAERESKPCFDSRPVAAEEPEKKEKNMSKEETLSPKVECSSGIRSDGGGVTTTAAKVSLPAPEKEKFEIDLMAPPPARPSPERDGEMECVAAEPKPKATNVETSAKPLLKEDEYKAEKIRCKEDTISEPEGKKLRAVVESESQKPDRNTELKLDLEKSDRETAAATAGGNKLNHHVQKQQQQQLPGGEKAAQASPLPLHLSVPGWPGGLPTMGYMAPSQGVVPADTSSLPSATMQPPHLFFNQPRPKRCATHCYIARNIHYHQQFTKMNPFWPAAAGSAPLYGAKACNLSLMPSTELQGNVLGRSSNSVPEKSTQSTSNSSDGAQRKQILLQQALPPGAASNILHGPAFIFPLSQQPHAAAAMAAASVRPPISGNAASSGASTSASMNGSASTAPAGGATTMSFSYPNMPGNETQYLAILQNNGYPFPVPAHVGAPPAYRGAPGQPIPFFNGSFYSSQMIHPPHLQPQQQQPQSGQAQQSPTPANQNPSVSTGSSAAQKHLQNQQQRPAINPGNPQGFPAQKGQSQPLSFQQRQQPRENATQQSETAGEDSPSTADSRAPRSNVAYGQNFAMPMQPTNFALMNSVASGGTVASSGGSSLSHNEKKPQQQGSKAGVESLQSQAYAMTFATFNGATTAPGLNMPSMAQNHAIFHSIPEAAARQGYHQIMAAAVAAQAAQQKMNYSASEDGKSGPNASASTVEERKAGAAGKTTANVGQSITFSRPDLADASVSAVTGNNVIDSSARLLNLSSAPPRNSSSAPTPQQQQLQRNQQQQQQHIMHLQKQQQYAAAAAAAAAARNKVPVTSNGSVFSDHNVNTSSVAAKYPPNALSGFPQNLVQSSGSPVQSPQWKSNSPRPTATQVQSPSVLSSSSAASSLKNVPQKQQSRPQQAQISFAANPKSLPSGPPLQQAPCANQSSSPPMLVGSPSTSSMSKSAGGSPRTAAATSTVNKAGQASSTLSSSQPSKNLTSPSVPTQSSSSTGGRNGPSILGNPHVTPASSGSKSQPPHQQQQQQQPTKHTLQQAQLFFSGAYMQPQQQHHHHHHHQHHHHPPPGNISISTASGYYLQRHQQQPGSSAGTSHSSCPPVSLSNNTTATVTATSDPAKAIAAAAAAAAAANNMKGGNLHTQGVTHSTAPYTSTQPPAGKMHHQLGPPGFPYVHAVPTAVQVKPADQKQPASE